MSFQPDIIVTVPESFEIAMVVEAKTSLRDLESTERGLKRYMIGMRCPVGLLVTPKRLRLYRDRIMGSKEDSVELIGQFDVRDVLRYRPFPGRRNEFENFVQSWIEGLSTEAGLRELPDDMRRGIERHVVPGISEGTVRAGHPRPAHDRS